MFLLCCSHSYKMIYTIEGTPKTQTLELPTGEEIQLKLPEGGGTVLSWQK